MYVTPSATSCKAVLDAIIKTRLHSIAFGDDKDVEEGLGSLSPTASEAEIIEFKQRQNMLAAWKSHKQKLQHQQTLEEVASLTNQVTTWRERTMMAQELLKNSSVKFFGRFVLLLRDLDSSGNADQVLLAVLANSMSAVVGQLKDGDLLEELADFVLDRGWPNGAV
ncbi:Imprinted and ancient [Mycena venus]|uniref:Imprinted and ancient n=1 Tax=Mycena venus TaxID=2733690 RepID=A0A8H7D4B8_9AGAR|nr:Imprinted and ancient [Mycena venus]